MEEFIEFLIWMSPEIIGFFNNIKYNGGTTYGKEN